MKTYEENMDLIESLKDFMGGDKQNVPIHRYALEDMKYICKWCNEYNIPQPFISPWAGGDGVQATWECEWYIEINSCWDYKSILFVKGNEVVNTHINSMRDAFILAKQFLTTGAV